MNDVVGNTERGERITVYKTKGGYARTLLLAEAASQPNVSLVDRRR